MLGSESFVNMFAQTFAVFIYSHGVVFDLLAISHVSCTASDATCIQVMHCCCNLSCIYPGLQE